MLKTKEGFEIVCMRHEDKNGVVKADVKALVEKEGLSMFGVEEMLDCDDTTIDAIYQECGRVWLVTKYGLVVHGSFYGGRRGVGEYYSSSGRFGVVGVRRKPHAHIFESQPDKCKDCGFVRA